MELRALGYFISTYELGSISGAARQCFVSQPSISAAIQQLEATLDVVLFIRHARGVLPTAAADKLYPVAKETSENAKSIMNLFSEGPAAIPLRFGLMRSLGAQRMSFLLKKITEKIENVELTLVGADEPCDVRIVLKQSVASNESFVPIWQDDYMLALPSHWPLANKSMIKLTELENLPFINREPCDALDKLKHQMENAAIGFQTRANIRTIEYAWQLVMAGIGGALLPDWHEIKAEKGISLRKIEDISLFKQIGLAYKQNKSNAPLIHTVKEICEATAIEHK